MTAGVKMALQVAALAVALTLVTPALWYEEVTDPEHPGTCWVRALSVRVSDGATLDLPECIGVSCYRSGDKMFLEYYSCAIVNAGPECTIQMDMTKPNPDCCPKPVCPSPTNQ
ncbi:uncharacterized protein [Panulirus ornatus]|uniref:uncharacterized protein n=1 Tax=Panulirus ornatus TaxID=150431 RepID=UPI003A84BEB1